MKMTRNDTCEHLLATGEQLCLLRGFSGMGLNELLSAAGVPKGSFYYYFRSKEAFGVAMLERCFTRMRHSLESWFTLEQAPARQRLLAWFERAEREFRHSGHIGNCLAVKISAEVCDLSEEMRLVLERGAMAQIAIFARVLKQAVAQDELKLYAAPEIVAETLHLLWLGASLQSKICREGEALVNAFQAIQTLLPGR